MRIGIISDIHANFDYLSAALGKLEESGVDKILCLGDLVGYYDCPEKVVRRMMEGEIECVKGNHDAYLSGNLAYDSSREQVYRIEEQRSLLSPESLAYLAKLPTHLELDFSGVSMYCTHSLPGDSQTYCYDCPILPADIKGKFDFYVFGHTHIPMVKYAYGECFVNPGSVGQPRDYSAKPSFAVVDMRRMSVEIVKFVPDLDGYCRKLEAMSIDSAAIHLLRRKERGCVQ